MAYHEPHHQPREHAPVTARDWLTAAPVWLLSLAALELTRLERGAAVVVGTALALALIAVFYTVSVARWAGQRRAADERLRKSEERFRSLVESTTDGVWETNRAALLTYVAPQIVTLIGRKPEELLGTSPFDLVVPDERARVREDSARMQAAQGRYALETSLRTLDGGRVAVEISAVPYLDVRGKFAGYRGVIRDMSERARARAALDYRDALLHVVNSIATVLLKTTSIEVAIPRALDTVGNAVNADRVVVFEMVPSDSGGEALSRRFLWESHAFAPAVPNGAAQQTIGPDAEELAAWTAPLNGGGIVTTTRSAAKGAVRRLLERRGMLSVLVVPIMVEKRRWGQIAFGDSKSERTWEDTEIEILRTLAQLVGNAIVRARYVAELADANTIVENSPTILYRLRADPEFPLVFVSRNIQRLGHEAADWTASPMRYQEFVHPDDMLRLREAFTRVIRGNRHTVVVEFRLRNAAGGYRWVENRCFPVLDGEGKVSGIEGILIDVTARKEAEERITLLARTDPLTGLANRRTFIERLRQEFANAKRSERSFALFYLDLDHFKDVNDTLGHAAGDALLKTVGERLSSLVRETDLVARIGGDEFALVQPDVSDFAQAGTLASKVLKALSAPYGNGSHEIHLTASIGISSFDASSKDAEEMLSQADLALYRAKEEGRDKYRFYTDELDVEVHQRLAMAEELRRALAGEEFELYYQPQVEVESGAIIGMEALLRWNHPTRGLVCPNDFLPAAERTGMIAPIGQWVLDGACRQLHEWREGGVAPPVLAVNLGAAQFRKGSDLAASVSTALERWGLSPSDLEIEVSEALLTNAGPEETEMLGELRALGIRLVIDDFGTEYSSLGSLGAHQVSRIKIPQQMIGAAMRDPRSAAMVRAIMGLARELDIDVVAQGVETEEQRAFLASAATVSRAQGYFYSAPVPASRASELLRQGTLGPLAAPALQ